MKYLLLFISAIYSACAIAQNSELINVDIKQIDSKEQIVLRYDTVNNRVWGVSFPFEYEIRDHTSTGTWLRAPTFYYSAEFAGFRFIEPGWNAAAYWMKIDGKYTIRPDAVRVGLQGKKYPYPTYYLVRSMHQIQETSDIQDSLAQYIPKIKTRKVNLGTLKEFKAKHPQLTERFLKGDSVSIKGYNKDEKFYEWIDLPIEY